MGLLDQQQLVDEMNGEGLQVPPDIEPVEFLMAIYRDPRQPMNRRIKRRSKPRNIDSPSSGSLQQPTLAATTSRPFSTAR
jgi:hypothetical protein